jgi:DNA-binding NarL/FixJ family response regulator
MKFAIIDDSPYKIESLVKILQRMFPDSSVEIAKSFQSGLRLLDGDTPDVILLDMSLPTMEKPDGRVGGRNRIFGGKELLAEMAFLDVSPRVIVVSQFETFKEEGKSLDLRALLRELARDFPTTFVGGVFYSTVDSGWESELEGLLIKATKSI